MRLECGISGTGSVTYVRAVPRIVGRYEIVGKLGEGGMATVYLARQRDLDRLVALKELRAFSSSDPSFAKRFLREARMAGSLSHPNIVTVHDYFEHNATPFIAMEYVEGGSLRPQIGRMSLPEVGGVMEGVLAALGYAGERGIVHRDIKPENVMVSSDGRVKIADFGIAKATDAFQTSGALTAEGTALGTPNYMAPEQALAEAVGSWTDLYACGVMAFEIFAGRPPFADTPEPLVVLMRQVNDPLPLVTDVEPSVDPRIASWIAQLTAKDPGARPQSAAAAWDQFEEILIALLGPRWNRDARLQAMAGPVPEPVATGALAFGGTAPAFAESSPATRRLDDGQLAATLPPNEALLHIDRTTALAGGGPAAKTAGGRGKRRVLLGLVALAIAAPVALAAARGAGDGARATTTPPRPVAAAPTTTPTDAPVATVASDTNDLGTEAAEARRLSRRYNAAATKVEALGASGAQAGKNAILANLMRQTARAYSRATRAAARGDVHGYTSAMAEAVAAKGRLDEAARSPADKPVAVSDGGGDPAGSDEGGDPPGTTACAGDSASDDPSDDDCGGEP
jgi:Protein kinase domain